VKNEIEESFSNRMSDTAGIECVEQLDIATRLVVVLSPALVAKDSDLLTFLDVAIQKFAPNAIVFVYEVCSTCGVSWENYCEHSSWQFSLAFAKHVPASVSNAIGGHEALPLRTAKENGAYSHEAMMFELRSRLGLSSSREERNVEDEEKAEETTVSETASKASVETKEVNVSTAAVAVDINARERKIRALKEAYDIKLSEMKDIEAKLMALKKVSKKSSVLVFPKGSQEE